MQRHLADALEIDRFFSRSCVDSILRGVIHEEEQGGGEGPSHAPLVPAEEVFALGTLVRHRVQGVDAARDARAGPQTERNEKIRLVELPCIFYSIGKVVNLSLTFP